MSIGLAPVRAFGKVAAERENALPAVVTGCALIWRRERAGSQSTAMIESGHCCARRASYWHECATGKKNTLTRPPFMRIFRPAKFKGSWPIRMTVANLEIQ
jgi:hypothetical protein